MEVRDQVITVAGQTFEWQVSLSTWVVYTTTLQFISQKFTEIDKVHIDQPSFFRGFSKI